MDRISRRDVAVGLSSTVGLSLVGARAAAEPFGGEVRVISGLPMGSGGDSLIRFYAARMESLLGAKMTVENFVESDKLEGNLATESLLAAKPDGRTIYIQSGAILVGNQVLAKKPNFDVITALQSFGTITKAPNTLVVSARSPYRSLPDLTAEMRRKGKAAKYGTPNGSIVRIIAALYKKRAGLEAAEVLRQRSIQVFEDLDSGAVDFAFSNNLYSVDQEKAGRIRILAISLSERLKAAPQYPTFNEYGYAADVDGWWAGFVPSGTPRAIVERLGKALSAAVVSPESVKFLNSVICDPWVETPEQSQAHLARQVEAWRGYVKLTGFEQQG